MAEITTETDGYRSLTGLIYVFNLIVGTGALTMPAAFSHAGWFLSLVIIILLSIVSFITVTFVVESMSIANAVIKFKLVNREIHHEHPLDVTLGSGDRTEDEDSFANGSSVNFVSEDVSETAPLVTRSVSDDGDPSKNLYDISHRVELGQMASMFFPSLAVKFFYVCISVYLYGDLAIYAAAISKSLRDVSCTYEGKCNETLSLNDACWESGFVTSRHSAYQLFVAGVLILLGPLAFFNVTKTKYLQLLTTFLRWASFSSMIVLAIIALVRGKGRGKPNVANISGLPNLFGVCVYSFMCHHSLPSLLTPIKNKKSIYKLLLLDYILILSFYLLLSFTGAFTFDNLQDIYTLNFQSQKCSVEPSSEIVPSVTFLEYFLPLFPVFTLSASFPIISITLTNNLKTLLLPIIAERSSSQKALFIIERFAFPLLAVVPPVILAFFTENLQILVGIVGSYAGAMIQYVIPALLVYYSRKKDSNDGERLMVVNHYDQDEHLRQQFRDEQIKRQFKSPFKGQVWIILVLLWSVISVVFVTIDHIIDSSKTEL